MYKFIRRKGDIVMSKKNNKEKFIPYEKRSKAAQKEATNQKRGSWNGVRPCTVSHKNKPVDVSRQQAKINLRKQLANGDV